MMPQFRGPYKAGVCSSIKQHCAQLAQGKALVYGLRMPNDATRVARVRFLGDGEGGRLTPPRSGTRSQLEIGDVMTSCVLSRTDDGEDIPLGSEVDVIVSLHFPEHFEEEFRLLQVARFFEGSNLVATGRFLERSV